MYSLYFSKKEYIKNNKTTSNQPLLYVSSKEQAYSKNKSFVDKHR